MIKVRPYQEDMVGAAWEALQRHRGVLGVAATGIGKTAVAALLARRWPHGGALGGRVVVLVDRHELLRQNVDAFREVCEEDQVEVEAGHQRPSHCMGLYGECGRIVLASVRSLCQPRRLRRWGRRDVGLLIVDEAHHCTNQSVHYASVLDYFADARVFGLTATPDRSDGVALGTVFEHVAFCYELEDAIRDGWLVPVQQQLETLAGWDLSDLREDGKGDYSIDELDRLMKQERPLHLLASAARKWACFKGILRRCLIFTTSTTHAHLVAAILNRTQPGSAVGLDGKVPTEERDWQLRRFSEGAFQYLCGMNLFLEAYNEPRIQVIVNGRPTKQRSLYAQMVGRGPRPWPDVVPALNDAPDAAARRAIIRGSAKPSLLAVDITGVAGTHKLSRKPGPVTCADLLGGAYPPAVRERARDVVLAAGGRMEIDKALREAQRLQLAAEMGRRQGVVMHAVLHSREVDPFDHLDVKKRKTPRALRGKPASPRQVAFLERQGVPVPAKLSFWDAKTLIDQLVTTRAAGPPSEAQERVLRRYKMYRDDMTWQEAHQVLDALEKAGWEAASLATPEPPGAAGPSSNV